MYRLTAHRRGGNILAMRFVKPGNCVIMNYHFTTAKAHITRLGGRVEELVKAEGLAPRSDPSSRTSSPPPRAKPNLRPEK